MAYPPRFLAIREGSIPDHGKQPRELIVADGQQLFKLHVSSLQFPLFVLLQQNGVDRLCDGAVAWECPHHIGRALHLGVHVTCGDSPVRFSPETLYAAGSHSESFSDRQPLMALQTAYGPLHGPHYRRFGSSRPSRKCCRNAALHLGQRDNVSVRHGRPRDHRAAHLGDGRPQTTLVHRAKRCPNFRDSPALESRMPFIGRSTQCVSKKRVTTLMLPSQLKSAA